MKKVGAKEVVQCSNDNYFLDLDVNDALSGNPLGCYAAGDVPAKLLSILNAKILF